METHKIDQLFKQKLERHSEPVSSDAFAKVQAQMKGKKQKKGFPWMIAASVSILLLISIGLGYNYNQAKYQQLAKIELKSAQLSFSELEIVEKPTAKEEKNKTGKGDQNKEIISPNRKPTATTIKVQNISRMASLEKVKSYGADLEINMTPELRLSPQKQENEVIVEIHYAYAETPKEENILKKSNNKLKSLASEFSLAELRSAKNDLFASAFQFNKK